MLTGVAGADGHQVAWLLTEQEARQIPRLAWQRSDDPPILGSEQRPYVL